MTSLEPNRRKLTWNRSDRVNLDSGTAGRARRIGILGEKLAESQLLAHDFTNVRNLNRTLRMNHPGADLYAERNGIGFWISVKARNKYTEGAKLNDRYKIDPEELLSLAECRARKPGSRTACVAVSFVMSERSALGGEPPRSYSCYLAPLDLTGGNGILMRPRHLATYQCLALNETIPLTEDVSDLENRYERRTTIARTVKEECR
jgi:hypothetical protein